MMINWLKKILKVHNDAEVLSELERLNNEVVRLRTQYSVFENDVMDQLLSKMERITKANQMRLKREKEREAVEDEPKEVSNSFKGKRVLGANGWG